MQIQRTQDFGNFYPRYCRKIKLKFNKTQHRSLMAALCFWIYWKIFLWLRTYKNDTIKLLHLWDTFVVEHKKEEKEKIKIVPLCRNIGEVIALNGLIFLLKGLWPGFENHWFVTAMIAWFIVAGFDLWYIEKSDRYYK